MLKLELNAVDHEEPRLDTVSTWLGGKMTPTQSVEELLSRHLGPRIHWSSNALWRECVCFGRALRLVEAEKNRPRSMTKRWAALVQPIRRLDLHLRHPHGHKLADTVCPLDWAGELRTQRLSGVASQHTILSASGFWSICLINLSPVSATCGQRETVLPLALW